MEGSLLQSGALNLSATHMNFKKSDSQEDGGRFHFKTGLSSQHDPHSYKKLATITRVEDGAPFKIGGAVEIPSKRRTATRMDA
eukprot:4773988-Pyramimonas_sp.AAC.1